MKFNGDMTEYKIRLRNKITGKISFCTKWNHHNNISELLEESTKCLIGVSSETHEPIEIIHAASNKTIWKLKKEKKMTIKEQLLKMGMKPEEIDNHNSDLYVFKNSISEKFVSEYEFKMNVTTFIDDIDHKVWYEIPFAYQEYYKEV